MKRIWKTRLMCAGAAERIAAWPRGRADPRFISVADRPFVRASLPRAARSAGSAPRRLLIADDEAILRDIYRMALSSEGVAITARGDGRSALDEIRRRNFDLLLLDLRMPEMGGIELLRRLRREEDLTPAIICTAELDVRAFLCGVRHGVVAFLRKPLSITALRRAVHEQLVGLSGCRFGAAFRQLGRRRFRRAVELMDRHLMGRESLPLQLWRDLCAGIARGREDDELETTAREIINRGLTVPFEV